MDIRKNAKEIRGSDHCCQANSMCWRLLPAQQEAAGSSATDSWSESTLQLSETMVGLTLKASSAAGGSLSCRWANSARPLSAGAYRKPLSLVSACNTFILTQP